MTAPGSCGFGPRFHSSRLTPLPDSIDPRDQLPARRFRSVRRQTLGAERLAHAAVDLQDGRPGVSQPIAHPSKI